jgi:DNA-binding GntR family transcriptional regulator
LSEGNIHPTHRLSIRRGYGQTSNWRFQALIAAACGNKLIERSYLYLLTLGLRISYLAYNAAHSQDAFQKHLDNDPGRA